MTLVKGRNGGNKPRNRNNRMHPNEARMREDYYSSAAIIANQQEASEMAALSINAPKSQEEVIMTEQTQQDQNTVPDIVTKPSTRRALPPRQSKQSQQVSETPVIILPPASDFADDELNINVKIDPDLFVTPVNEGYTDRLTPEEAELDQHLDALQAQNPDVNVKEEFTKALFDAMPPETVSQVIAELPPEVKEKIEVILEPEVRKRTIPETRGARPSMLPPKVEVAPKVEPTVTVAPKGYTDAGDHYERKVEVSALGVKASVTMTKPKPGSAGLIFEGRIDLEEAEGVQFWRPVFNRKVTADDHIPAHYVPAILQAARYRNAGLFDPVFLIAIPCTVGDMNDPAVEVCSGDDGTVITFKAA